MFVSDSRHGRLRLVGSDHIQLTDDTLWRKLDGEAVLVQLASGTYYGVNEVGAEALTMMVDGVGFSALVAALLDRFEVDEAVLRADLTELLGDMVDRGLVLIRSDPAETEATAG